MSTTDAPPAALRRVLIAAALVTAAVVSLSACGSSGSSSGGSGGALAGTLNAPGLYGSLPSQGTPKQGGTITYGNLAGSTTQTYILPLVPAANASTSNYWWIDNQFLPLYTNEAYGSEPQVDYSLSLANRPVFSDGNKTVTIELKQGFKWSDGKPVDAQDLLFDIALIKAAVAEQASNWAGYTAGFLPDSLANITATGPYTVVMHLTKAFNPSFFLNQELARFITPMPSTAWNVAAAGGPHLDWKVPANAKKIYDYLGKAGGQVGTFATNPLWKIADGPFVLSKFSSVTSSWTLKANPSYGGANKPHVDAVEGVTYTGTTPQLNALLTGSLDVANIDFSQLAEVSTLKAHGYTVFAYPDLGWAGAVYNFKDKTGHFDKIVSQLYFRQAMMYLENEPAIVQGVYHGAAGIAYGPVPAVPKTPFTPANSTNPAYPYNPAKAVELLKAHGWNVVPNGTTTCKNAGSAPSQCGAGIPAGTPLSFTWATQTAAGGAYISLTDEAIASQAKQAAGIDIKLFQKDFNFIVANYNTADPSVAKYNNDWGVENYGGFTDNFYPTQNSIFNTGGSNNSGGYSDPTMNQLITNSVFGSDPNAVTKEASYGATSLPVLWEPNFETIWAVSHRVGGTPQSFIGLTQYGFWPQFWYLKK
ncbi:MAG: ABC transporter substrate-binding protein [Actinomycetota bacterium]|nr:ABC transporter substrate-binding protein [Actinomycetota bacterium]